MSDTHHAATRIVAQLAMVLSAKCSPAIKEHAQEHAIKEICALADAHERPMPSLGKPRRLNARMLAAGGAIR